MNRRGFLASLLAGFGARFLPKPKQVVHGLFNPRQDLAKLWASRSAIDLSEFKAQVINPHVFSKLDQMMAQHEHLTQLYLSEHWLPGNPLTDKLEIL